MKIAVLGTGEGFWRLPSQPRCPRSRKRRRGDPAGGRFAKVVTCRAVVVQDQVLVIMVALERPSGAREAASPPPSLPVS